MRAFRHGVAHRLSSVAAAARWCSTGSSGLPDTAAPPSGAPSPLREGVTRADFRRFCLEQGASLVSGVPTAAFVHYLERVRNAGPTAELQLRDMACFRFNGPRIALDAAAGEESPMAFEDELKAFALRLPPDGIAADDAKARLAAELPAFSPKLVGAVTVRDVFTRFPHLFTVVRGGDSWVVKPALRPATPAGSEALKRRASAEAQADVEASDAGAAEAARRALPDAELLEELDRAVLRAYSAQRRQGDAEEGKAVWADAEPLLRNIDPALRSQVRDWSTTLAQLPSLEVRATPLLRPARRLRSAHVFVDGDGLTAHHLDGILSRFRVNMTTSTATVARPASTPALTTDDTLTPHDIPPYMVLEAAAERLRRSHHVVLKDVVYVCCDAKAQTYVDHVARAVAFPDAEVWVLTPTADVCVASWKVAAAEGAEAADGSTEAAQGATLSRAHE